MAFDGRTGTRAALGVGAFLVADAITGMAAYCLITLSALWYFSWSWIQLVGEFASRGRAFGTTAQLDLAWVGVFVLVPVMVAVVYLTIRAYRVPIDLARRLRRTRSDSARGST